MYFWKHKSFTPKLLKYATATCPVLVNDLRDALGAVALLFSDDVRMVTVRTQNINLDSSLIDAWDLRTNPVKCNYLTIGQAVPLRFSFPLMGPASSHLYPK